MNEFIENILTYLTTTNILTLTITNVIKNLLNLLKIKLKQTNI